MKRDNDYIRDMLFEAEADESHLFLAVLTMGADQKATKKHYHAELLCDAGLLVSSNKGVYRMTSQGHDYLDAIRDEGIWKQTKDAVAEAGGSVALEITKAVAIGFVKTKLSKHIGFDL